MPALDFQIKYSPESVLIFAPTGQDAHLLSDVLGKDHIVCEVFHDLPNLCVRMSKDFGAVLLAEEALDIKSLPLFRKQLESQEPWSDAPIVIMTTGGETTLASLRIAKEFSPAGNVTLLERPFRPITLVSAVQVALRSRKRQFQVKELLRAQQEATQVRDEFISIASHELKTPLTSLKLQTQLNQRMMKRENGEIPRDRVNKLVENTDRQVDRLSRLVEDMLDVSRINTGKLALQKTEVDLAELVSEIVERLTPQLSAARCTVSLTLENGVKGSWDRFRIEQVIINLVTNAIRYAAEKPIHVSVSQTDGIATLVVRDEGCGIAPENRERIFQRFERILSSHGIDGLGLGLYICKQIVEAHGGSIRVDDKQIKGACFVVELPMKAEENHGD